MIFLKCSFLRNSNLFKTLAQKAFQAPFSRKYRPPRKPSSRENFPLPGILSIFWIESSVYIYYRYPPREDNGSIYTTVILPSRFLKCSFVRNSNLFKTLAPKAFQAPFSCKYRPPKKTLFPGNLPLAMHIKFVFDIIVGIYILPLSSQGG